MKPTVSETRSSPPSGRRTCRRSGSRVTNRASDTSAPACVSALNRVALAGVGITDQRHRGDRGLLPPLAKLRAALADALDIDADGVDAGPDSPPVGLELGFAGTPRADAAAEPRKRRPGADQTRQQIFELGELHLQLAFPRARAAGEDVEDQLRAIDDLALDLLLDLPQLGRGQLVVEDDHVRLGFGARHGERRQSCRRRETSRGRAWAVPEARAGRLRRRPLRPAPRARRATARHRAAWRGPRSTRRARPARGRAPAAAGPRSGSRAVGAGPGVPRYPSRRGTTPPFPMGSRHDARGGVRVSTHPRWSTEDRLPSSRHRARCRRAVPARRRPPRDRRSPDGR